MVYQVIPSL